MSHLDFTNEEILKFAKSLGLGFYRVSHEGKFVECDDKARKIFSIPQGKDLSGFSIKSFYINPEERDVRIQRLITSELKFFCGTLSMRIDGKNKVLFDICKYDKSYRDKGNFVAFASEIENITLIPQMLDTFPMGIYEVDNEGKILRVNKKLVEILKYKNESEILIKNIREFFEDRREMFEFNQKIKEDGFAQQILKFIDANKKIIEVECFSQYINEFKLARWAMLTDVTRRERYKRLFAGFPTGVYYIENDRVKDCNYQFSRILGFDRSEGAIGIDTRDTFANPNDIEKFFSDLESADKNNVPLQNYPLKIKRKKDGKIVTISIDTHLIKDGNGKVIGREGTIRDITERVELEKRVNEAEKNLEKTTADINKFIHTFLHPVVKFAGNSELLNQVISVLYQTIPLDTPPTSSSKELGEMLMTMLKEVNTKISGMDDKFNDGCNETHPKTGVKRAALANFKENLTRIINIFDYRLKTEKSQKLLDSAIRDTALWTLAELNRAKYSRNSHLKPLIKKDFIAFLQAILFNYLKHGTQILMGETEKMKKGVEALRSFIGMKKVRKYTFEKYHIGRLLEDSIQRFKPLLLEENIEVDFYYTGNLAAEISQNDIERVICNLLQNVQKYSYKGESRFVKIRARELQPDDKVEFFVESFGIPIKKEEIDSGAIWKFGYRGELSYASDRDGTGVGLADAKDVIDAHGGEIFLTSKPVADDGTPPGYKVPYITKITIRIPKSRQRKE